MTKSERIGMLVALYTSAAGGNLQEFSGLGHRYRSRQFWFDKLLFSGIAGFRRAGFAFTQFGKISRVRCVSCRGQIWQPPY